MSNLEKALIAMVICFVWSAITVPIFIIAQKRHAVPVVVQARNEAKGK